MVPDLAESASSGNLLEMQILRPQDYWILNSEGEPCNLCFNKPSSRSWSLLKFENHWPRAVILRLWYIFISPGEHLKLPRIRPQPKPIKSESLGVDEAMSVPGFKSQIRYFQEDSEKAFHAEGRFHKASEAWNSSGYWR